MAITKWLISPPPPSVACCAHQVQNFDLSQIQHAPVSTPSPLRQVGKLCKELSHVYSPFIWATANAHVSQHSRSRTRSRAAATEGAYRNWQVTGLILPVDVLERRLTSTIPRINDPPPALSDSVRRRRASRQHRRSLGLRRQAPCLRRAAVQHWGLTARRARPDPATVPPMRLRCYTRV